MSDRMNPLVFTGKISYTESVIKRERKTDTQAAGSVLMGAGVSEKHKNMSTGEPQNDSGAPEENTAKIRALREMIQNAERTIHGAKAMLLQIEGKKKTGRPRKYQEDQDGNIVQGTFDGQFMQGADGKQYPVPANYASKSKLVEGDMLKLTITPDGSFIYKQIGPIERRHVIGIVTQDEHGSYQIVAENRVYRVLLASVTYFKLEPGDEVAILVPREGEARFAAVENVLQKGALVPEETLSVAKNALTQGEGRMQSWKENLGTGAVSTEEAETGISVSAEEVPADGLPEDDGNILEEWIRDMEALEREEAERETAQRLPTE